MKILVCGGRDYNNKNRVYEVLDDYRGKVTAIIHGAAKGLDTLAGKWAKENNIQEVTYPADWAKYGKAAGYKRNVAMLEKCHTW